MGLEDKAIENKNAADTLHAQNLQNAATSRYYYSAYQFLLDIAQNKMNYQYQQSSSTSHEDLFDHVENYLTSCNTNNFASYTRALQCVSLIKNMKRERKKADYTKENADSSKMKDKHRQFKISLGEVKNVIR